MIALALLVGCEDTRRARDRSSSDVYQLRGALADAVGDASKVAVLAEAVFADRRAAIVLSSVQDGQLVQPEVIAYAFVRDGRGWRRLDQRSSPTEDALRELLGGDYELVRPSGPSIDDLGPALLSSAKRFRSALRMRDDAAAIDALESFARCLGARLLLDDSDDAFEILEDDIEQVKRVVIRDVGPGDHPTAKLEIEICESRCETIDEDTTLTRQGRGWAIDEL